MSEQYKYIQDSIKAFYYTDSDVLRCRSIRALDQFRHADYSDDVQVLFVKESVSSEAIWVRTQKVLGEDSGMYLVDGVMLNTPYADYGVDAGAKIIFGTGVVDNNGTRLCFALLTEK